jgi:hypothetical protein
VQYILVTLQCSLPHPICLFNHQYQSTYTLYIIPYSFISEYNISSHPTIYNLGYPLHINLYTYPSISHSSFNHFTCSSLVSRLSYLSPAHTILSYSHHITSSRRVLAIHPSLIECNRHIVRHVFNGLNTCRR